MERDFRIFKADTIDFIGAFNTTENKAKDKALRIVKEVNRIRQQIGYEPYAEVIISACYMLTENNIEFNLIIN